MNCHHSDIGQTLKIMITIILFYQFKTKFSCFILIPRYSSTTVCFETNPSMQHLDKHTESRPRHNVMMSFALVLELRLIARETVIGLGNAKLNKQTAKLNWLKNSDKKCQKSVTKKSRHTSLCLQHPFTNLNVCEYMNNHASCKHNGISP